MNKDLTNMIALHETKNKSHAFVLEKIAHHNYFVICLTQYDLLNSDGNYMRVKSVADFGNYENSENLSNAVFCMVALCESCN